MDYILSSASVGLCDVSKSRLMSVVTFGEDK